MGTNYDAISKKYFTFSNTYNSFLRINKTNIVKTGVYDASSDHLMDSYNTNQDFTYNNSQSLTSNDRKKEGNHIITYTNKEIRDGNLSGFIDARENENFLEVALNELAQRLEEVYIPSKQAIEMFDQKITFLELGFVRVAHFKLCELVFYV